MSRWSRWWFLALACLPPTLVWSQALDRRHAGMINPLEYGSTCSAATLNAAISGAPATQRVLMLTPVDRAQAACTWTLTANVTVPATMTLHVPKGVAVVVNSGSTLTVNGPVRAETSDWWSGAGTVAFTYGVMSRIDATSGDPLTGGKHVAGTDLPTVLTAIGSTVTTLRVRGPVTVAANATIPATTTVEMQPGGQFVVSAGVTLTIAGGFLCPPTQQCFAGASTSPVLFQRTSGKPAPVPRIWVPWFGWPGDGATNGNAAFQSAANAVSSAGGMLEFPPGDYLYTASPTFKNYTTIKCGDGPGGQEAVILRYQGTGQALAMLGKDRMSLLGCMIQGNATAGTIGLYLSGSRHLIKDNRFNNFTGAGSYGAVLTSSDAPDTSYVEFHNNWYSSNQIGLFIERAGSPSNLNNFFYAEKATGNVTDGVRIDRAIGVHMFGLHTEQNATGGTGYNLNILDGWEIYIHGLHTEGVTLSCGTRGNVWLPDATKTNAFAIFLYGYIDSEVCNFYQNYSQQRAMFVATPHRVGITSNGQGAPAYTALQVHKLFTHFSAGLSVGVIATTGAGFSLTNTFATLHGRLRTQDTGANVVYLCEFYLQGGFNTVVVYHDPNLDGGAANCSTTKDNAGTLNVYYDAAGSPPGYFLQNRGAGAATITVHLESVN